MKVSAKAHPNIALIKYWGKRSIPLNLPAVGSLSITLGTLETTTTIEPATGEEAYYLGGERVCGQEEKRLRAFVDMLRIQGANKAPLLIKSHNSFPTAAGLASSASGFAALTMALYRYLDLPLTIQGLSEAARQGSGSACRSIHGGFVEWRRGEDDDGSDSIAVPLAHAGWWDLKVLVCVLARGKKAVGSREGMALTAKTSPMFQGYVDGQEADLDTARQALLHRDFDALAKVSEASCLKMVSTWLTTYPPLFYWRPETYAVILKVQKLRQAGYPVFFTTDAGPHVKVICEGSVAEEVEARLKAWPEVLEVLNCPVGGPATVETLP